MTPTLQNYYKFRPFVASSSIFCPEEACLPGSPSPGVVFVAGCLHFVLYSLLFLFFVYNTSYPPNRLAPSPARGFRPCLPLLYDQFCCSLESFVRTSCFCIFPLVFVSPLVPVAKLTAFFTRAVWVSAPSLANFRLFQIVSLRLSQQTSSGAVRMAESVLYVCVLCVIAFFVFVFVSVCLSVLQLSVVFARAVWVSAPSLANFRLFEIASLRLSQQTSSGAVLIVQSDFCLHGCFVLFVSFLSCVCVCSFVCWPVFSSLYEHTHPSMNCFPVHTFTHFVYTLLCVLV
jgi:hypothetical protein